MKIFTLEHAPASYFADFVLYPTAILASFIALLVYAPSTHWLGLALACVLGLAAWSLMEYVLHRYVLHGIEPFKGWHEEHNNRPFALIGTSTLARDRKTRVSGQSGHVSVVIGGRRIN